MPVVHGIYHTVFTIWYVPYGVYQWAYGIYNPKKVYTMRQPGDLLDVQFIVTVQFPSES
jgi:hypothetical protein